jgi:hypothetical protein
MTPVEMRRLGAAIVVPVLARHGFAFENGVADRGSGGAFARGAFVRGNRRLEFSTRDNLGEVVYRVSERALAHEDFMRAVGARGKHQYPGFSDDPLDGFRWLAADIAHFGTVFVTGTDADLEAIIAEAERTRPPKGLAALDSLGG